MRPPEAYGQRATVQKGRRTRELSEKGHMCLGDVTQKHGVASLGQRTLKSNSILVSSNHMALFYQRPAHAR